MCLLKAAIQLALTSVFIFLGLPIQNYCNLGDLTQLKFILMFRKARSLKPRCQQGRALSERGHEESVPFLAPTLW